MNFREPVLKTARRHRPLRESAIVFVFRLFAVACWWAIVPSAAGPDGLQAGTFYVAPHGKSTNDGTRDRPWPSVEFALGRVGGGHTIMLCPGVYNLCWPKSKYDGPHGISVEPGFLAAGQGVYWLKKDSPAIGKGSPEHALPLDFWGRPRPWDRPPDLGAFAYDLGLLEPDARVNWHFGWAYGYAPGKELQPPDLWALPPVVPKTPTLFPPVRPD